MILPITINNSPSALSTENDTRNLATYIKKLKRSPESPSRLTLPPITAVTLLDSHAQTQSQAQASDCNWEREWDWEEVCQIGQRGGLDWSERLQGFDYDSDRIEIEHVEDTSLEQVEDLPPVDPFSPPPASPKLVQLSPVIPTSPLLGHGCDEMDYDDNDHDNDHENENSGLQLDLDFETETKISITSVDIDFDNDNDIESLTTHETTLSSRPVTVSSTRRRRTTLSEVEDYRKYALWKNAFQTALAIEVERAERQVEVCLWTDVDDSDYQDDSKEMATDSSFENEIENNVDQEESASELPTSTFTAWELASDSDPSLRISPRSFIECEREGQDPASSTSTSSLSLIDNDIGDFDKENKLITGLDLASSRSGMSESDIAGEDQFSQNENRISSNVLERRPLVEIGIIGKESGSESELQPVTCTSDDDAEMEGEEEGSPELSLLITPSTPCAPLQSNSLPLPNTSVSSFDDVRDRVVVGLDRQVENDDYSTVGLGLGLAV